MDSSNSGDGHMSKSNGYDQTSNETTLKAKSAFYKYFDVYCDEIMGYYSTFAKTFNVLYKYFTSMPRSAQFIIGLLINFFINISIHFTNNYFTFSELLKSSSKSATSMALFFSLVLNEKPLIQSILVALSVTYDKQLSSAITHEEIERLSISVSFLLIGFVFKLFSYDLIKTHHIIVLLLLALVSTIIPILLNLRISLYSQLIVVIFCIVIYCIKKTEGPLEFYHITKYYKIQNKLALLFSFSISYIIVTYVCIMFSVESCVTRFDNFLKNLLDCHNFAPLVGLTIAILINGNSKIKIWFVEAFCAFLIIRNETNQYQNSILDMKILLVNGYALSCIENTLESFFSTTIFLLASLMPANSVYNIFQV